MLTFENLILVASIGSMIFSIAMAIHCWRTLGYITKELAILNAPIVSLLLAVIVWLLTDKSEFMIKWMYGILVFIIAAPGFVAWLQANRPDVR